MKKFFSTRYSHLSFDVSLFVMRLSLGGFLFMYHGLPKLISFSERKASFSDPYGLSPAVSLVLTIFAEVFCSLLLVAGLLTRFAAFVLVILFLTICLIIQKNTPLEEMGKPILFLVGSFMILLVGPGKWSLDKLAFK